MQKTRWNITMFSAILLAGILLHLTAEGLSGVPLFADWLPHLARYRLWITLVIGCAFVIVSLFVYKRAGKLTIRTISQTKTRAHRAVIVLLSPSDCDIVSSDTKPGFPVTIKTKPLRNNETPKEVSLPGKNLNDDITALNVIRWNWQQILRGLKPHIGVVNFIHIIGSKTTEEMPQQKGSWCEIDQAVKLIRQYVGDITIDWEKAPVDFKLFDELKECLEWAIQDIKFKKRDIRDEDIVIDITGGQKTASIAGAAATMSGRVKFQYVETNPPNDCLTYNVVAYVPPSSLGH